MHQVGIPVDIRPEEVTRKTSLGGAIDFCLEAGGIEPKVLLADLKLDKAQLSRWQSGQEGVNWPKLVSLMDYCGNDAPLWWMVAKRNYDLHSLRRTETEFERQNRLLREENSVLRRALRGAPA